jgi:ABC-type antimicrobial peptide transport system permease subunit
MTLARLLRQNLFYHWRGNSAVLLGVAVGTAVLTGALLVGDSLRGSLRDLTLEQLGWVDQSLVSGRFIREQLADELSAGRVSPIILLQGTASAGTTRPSAATSFRRAGRVTIMGVDQRFWRDKDPVGPSQASARSFWNSTNEEVVLNAALAGELGVAAGDTVTLVLQKVSTTPRETLLGRRDAGDVVDELKLKVHRVIADQGLARFSLNPSPATPRNAFVPLAVLQDRLHQPGRVNALLAGGAIAELQDALRRHLTLDDWGLTLHTPESRTQALFEKLDHNRDGKLEAREWRRRLAEAFVRAVDKNHDGILDRAEVVAFYKEQANNGITLESRQLLLESGVADTALAAGRAVRLHPMSIFAYLANTISDGKQGIPYSLVAALDPQMILPLPGGALRDDEIVLVDWKESPLGVRPGDRITLTYFEPEMEGRLEEKTATFRLHSLMPMDQAWRLNQPELSPEFPGITDKLDIRDWNPPFPYDNTRIQSRDERYWEEYRTTPKAFVTMATAQRLWGSRFGRLTSMRFRHPTRDLTKVADDFRAQLLEHLKPEQGGLVFESIRRRSLESSAGASDFGGLFLGFSFFLIAAALLLVGLLVRLNLDRRASEIGLLLASGFRRRTVRWLWLVEGGVLAAVGGLVGLLGALVYARLMLDYLRANWPGGLDQSFLRLHAHESYGLTYFIGYFAALLVSVLTIAWAVRILGRVSPRALLTGETAEAIPTPNDRRPPRSLWIGGVALVTGIGLIVLGAMATDQKMRAMSFFSSGALFLTAGLCAIWFGMRGRTHGRVSGRGLPALTRLGARNAARQPVRSLLTAGLLAAATFLIVAVQSFYRDPGRGFLDAHGGSGGFALLGEADVPIFQDLNTSRGQDELSFSDETRKALQGVAFFPFRLHAGDDTSCLNLYQPRQPRLLGVPHRLVERGGFQFKASAASTPEEQANPWLLLEETQDDSIPVFGEANTVEWILHKGLGQTLEVMDGSGAKKTVRFVGLLENSVFQSELLVSESNFLKLFPREEGYQVFLIQAGPEQTAKVRSLLETALAGHGFTVTPSVSKLEAYLAVENTYLSTFQALGGLGLLLGALGLAVVLMRSAWERRGELALLRALGFRRTALGWLVLAENTFLLVMGLALGTVTALLAVAPHLFGGPGAVPWFGLLSLLALVLGVGLLAGTAALAATLRAPLVPALRRE